MEPAPEDRNEGSDQQMSNSPGLDKTDRFLQTTEVTGTENMTINYAGKRSNNGKQCKLQCSSSTDN